MKRLGRYTLLSIITLLLSIVSVKALDLKNKFYNVEYNKDIDPILIYEANGHLDLYDKNAEYNVTLEAKNNNGRYGIYISGKPIKSDGQVHFTGMTKDSNEIEINYDIVVNISRNTTNVTKTYNATAGTNVGNILVYQVTGSDTLKAVNTSQNGITLKTANVNGKYGLYLMGTPTQGGTIHFTGKTINESNTYTIEYDITMNVANKTREVIEVTKTYNGTINKSIGDKLVYQTDSGKLGSVNVTKNGLTLKTDTDGLRLSGTPTQGGVVNFNGTVYEGDSYTIQYNVTINVPNPNKPQKKVEKLYSAVLNKDIGKVLVYESTKTLPDFEKTDKGITLKTETVDGKTKIYLLGKPNEEGKVIFSGSVDEGDRDVIYYIIINIANKATTTSSTTNSGTSNNAGSRPSSNSGSNNNTTTPETPKEDEEPGLIEEEPIVEQSLDEMPESTQKEVQSRDCDDCNTEWGYIENDESTEENNIVLPAIIGGIVIVGILAGITVMNNKKKKSLNS